MPAFEECHKRHVRSDKFSVSHAVKSPNVPLASAGRLPMPCPIGLVLKREGLRELRGGERESVAPLVKTHWADVPERQLILRGG
jgi:hypothetical protein